MAGIAADLTGRTAVVTGAAQGLGLAIAEGLIAAGARVALVDVKLPELKQAEKSISSNGGRAVAFQADVAEPEQVRELAAAVTTELGAVDILVNNAGVRTVEPVLEIGIESWRRAIDVNLTGPFLMIQAFGPGMVERRSGWIVNVTSVAAELAFTNRAAYNASKGGLAMLTKSVALELGRYGVRCNAVAPGIIETPLNSDYFADPKMRDSVLSNTPVGRWGQPPDIVAPVLFLCSAAADFVNGATIPVDGGWLTGKGY